MILTTKTKYVIALILIMTAFATGRFSVQKSVVKSTTSLVSDSKTNQNSDTHTQTTITTVKTPDGTVKTIQQISQVKDVQTTTTADTTIHSQTTVTPTKTNTINISALVGNDFSHGLGITPIYGVSASKEILGPITAGVFGLNNGVIGVSVGLNF